MIALVLIVIRLLDPPEAGLDREVGAWLGLVCAAGITVGGYLGMQDRQRDARRQPPSAAPASPATWIAQAMIVIIGLTPTEVGSRLASAT